MPESSTTGGEGRRPLNGTKTHPLSAHALDVLKKLDRADCPAREINPGVLDRLMREFLAEPYAGPSPYRTVKGVVLWMRITDAGRSVLAAFRPASRAAATDEAGR